MQYFLLILIFFFQKCVYVYAVDAVPVGAVNILRHSQILADSSIEKVPRRWATFKKDAIRFSATVPSVTGTSTKRTSSCAGVVLVESVESILLEYMCMFYVTMFLYCFYGFMLFTFSPCILTDSPPMHLSANISITSIGEFLFIRSPFSTGVVEINIRFHSLCSTSRKHFVIVYVLTSE